MALLDGRPPTMKNEMENANDEQWWSHRRDLDDGRVIFVVNQLLNAKITLGHGEETYDEQWCYPSLKMALIAAIAWNPDEERDPPLRWIRHVGPGGIRRRKHDEAPSI